MTLLTFAQVHALSNLTHVSRGWSFTLLKNDRVQYINFYNATAVLKWNAEKHDYFLDSDQSVNEEDYDAGR